MFRGSLVMVENRWSARTPIPPCIDFSWGGEWGFTRRHAAATVAPPSNSVVEELCIYETRQRGKLTQLREVIGVASVSR